jgi:hypothetical protein
MFMTPVASEEGDQSAQSRILRRLTGIRFRVTSGSPEARRLPAQGTYCFGT